MEMKNILLTALTSGVFGFLVGMICHGSWVQILLNIGILQLSLCLLMEHCLWIWERRHPNVSFKESRLRHPWLEPGFGSSGDYCGMLLIGFPFRFLLGWLEIVGVIVLGSEGLDWYYENKKAPRLKV